jgi:hypothetical protein
MAQIPYKYRYVKMNKIINLCSQRPTGLEIRGIKRMLRTLKYCCYMFLTVVFYSGASIMLKTNYFNCDNNAIRQLDSYDLIYV